MSFTTRSQVGADAIEELAHGHELHFRLGIYLAIYFRPLENNVFKTNRCVETFILMRIIFHFDDHLMYVFFFFFLMFFFKNPLFKYLGQKLFSLESETFFGRFFFVLSDIERRGK